MRLVAKPKLKCPCCGFWHWLSMLDRPIPALDICTVTCAGARGFPIKVYTPAEVAADPGARASLAWIAQRMLDRIERVRDYLRRLIDTQLGRTPSKYYEEE